MPDFLTLLDKQAPQGQSQQPVGPTAEDQASLALNSTVGSQAEAEAKKKQQEMEDEFRKKEQEKTQSPEALAQKRFADKYTPLEQMNNQQEVEDSPYTWTPRHTQQGFVEKTSESLMRGFGKHVIGGTGDMVQMFNLLPGWKSLFGTDIADGNALSRYLQKSGEDIASNHEVYIPDELKDPQFNLKTMMNPEFWSGQVAEYIPQLVEFIFISRGASGLAKAGARKVAKGISKGIGKEATTKLGANVSKNTTEMVGRNALEEIVETGANQGKGLLSKFMTTAGDATAGFQQGAGIVGGGVSMNVLSGMLNAGQLVNTMKEHKDPTTGESLYTDEELRAMASGTMIHNLSYLPIDMLSWGVTYAKDSGGLGRAFSKTKTAINGKPMNPFYNREAQLKFSAKAFEATLEPTKSMLSRVYKVGAKVAKPLFEGMEETFQETFEEWAKKKAVHDATGKPMEYESYWDFYNSAENEATKSIAFALGMLGGAGANVAEHFNKSANDNYKLWSRSENLKQRQYGREAEFMQQWHIADQMINNKLEGGISNQEFLEDQLSRGNIMEGQEFDQQMALAEEIDKNFEQAKAMNIRGKVKFLQEKSKLGFYNHALKFEAEKMKVQMANYDDTIKDPKEKAKAKKEAGENYETLVNALKNELALATENVENLALGREATVSYTKFLKDENGNTKALGLTKEQMFDFYNEPDDAIYEKIKSSQKTTAKSLFERLTKTGKEAFESIKESAVNLFDNTKEEFQKKKEEKGFETAIAEPIMPNNAIQFNKKFAEQTIEDLDKGLAMATEEISKVTDEEQKKKLEADKVVLEQYIKARKKEKTAYDEKKAKESTIDPEKKKKGMASRPINNTIGKYAEQARVTPEQVVGELETELADAEIDFTDEKTAKAMIKQLAGTSNGRLGKMAQSMTIDELVDAVYDMNSPEVQETTEEKKDDSKEPESQEKETEEAEEVEAEEVEDKIEDADIAVTDGLIDATFKAIDKTMNFFKKILEQVNKVGVGAITSKVIAEAEALMAEAEPMITELMKRKLTSEQKAKLDAKLKEMSDFLNTIEEGSPLKKLTATQQKKLENFKESIKNFLGETKTLFEKVVQKVKKVVKKTKEESQKKKNERILNENHVKSLLRAKFYGKDYKHIQMPLIDANPAYKLSMQNELDAYLTSTIGKVTYGPQVMHKAMALNAHLSIMFPNNKIQVYPFTNLLDSIGDRALGYAVASAILIDERAWEQKDIYMHEFAHIFYQLTRNEPATMEMIRAAASNKPLIKDIMKTYSDRVLWSIVDKDGTRKVAERGMIDNEWFNAQVAEGIAQQLPLAEQEVILEEAFAHTLQGPLSKEFNMHFDKKADSLRQYRVKKWWVAQKQAAVTAESNTKDLLDALNNGEQVNYNDLQSHIFDTFVSSIKGKDVSTRGRASRNLQMTEEQASSHLDIREKYASQLDKSIRLANEQTIIRFKPSDVKEAKKYDNDSQEKTTETYLLLDKLDEDRSIHETLINDYWDKTFDKADSKMGQMIRDFSKFMNSHISDTHLTEVLEKNKDAAKVDYFSENMFKTKIMELARKEQSWTEFIRLLEESPDTDIQAFLKYMAENTDDMYPRLRSAHFLYTNSAVIAPLIHTVNASGKYDAISPVSRVEQKLINKIKNQTFDDAAIEDAINTINNSTDQKAIRKATRYLIKAHSLNAVNVNEVLKNGYLIVNNKSLPFKQAIQTLLKQNLFKDGLGVNFRKSEPLIKAILNTARAYGSTSIVIGPDGNNVSPRIISNHLIKFLTGVSTDLLEGMTFEKFSQKYAGNMKNRNKAIKEIEDTYKTAKGKLATETADNLLLKSWYDNFQKTGELPMLVMDVGNKNDMSKSNNTYKDSTPNQQLTNELLQFISALNGQEDSYLGSMDIFGDSSRRYLVGLPMHHFNFTDSGALSTNGNKIVQTLYTQYASMRLDNNLSEENQIPLLSLKEFKQAFIEATEDFKKTISDNANDYAKIDILNDLFVVKTETVKGLDNKLKTTTTVTNTLTEKGERVLQDFVFNRVANTFYMHTIINPGIPLANLVKRHKGNIAPVMAIDPNLRVEKIFWNNEYTYTRMANGKMKKILQNDSGQYILDVDAVLIERAGKGSIDFNKGYKLLSHTIERDNKNFKDQSAQMKGYTSILSDENTKPGATNAKLRPLYELLMARRAKFIEWYAEEFKENRVPAVYDEEYRTQLKGDTRPKYIGIITPISAEKASLLPNTKNQEGVLKFASLEALSSPEGMEAYSKVLDGMYYETKKKGGMVKSSKDNFVGIDGSNFGPQQVMDKEYHKAVFAVQAISSIIAKTNEPGEKAVPLQIQALLQAQKEHILNEKVLKFIEDKAFDSSYTEYILRTTNQKDADPFTIMAFLDGALPYSPHQAVFAINQIRKQFIRYGNNLLTPGTYAQTISDIGYGRTDLDGNTVYINGSSSLNSYGESNVDGKVGTTPMETVLPKSQDDGTTRARNHYYGAMGRAKAFNALSHSIALKNEFGLSSDGEINAFLDSHAIYSTPEKSEGNIVGYYIPGEVVMMTRIPHNGPAFMGVAEVVAFGETGASNAMVPAAYYDMIGADHDGDALFIYKEAKQVDENGTITEDPNFKNWNKALELMKSEWMSPRMRSMLFTDLAFVEEIEKITTEIKKDLQGQKRKKGKFDGYDINKFVMPFSPMHYKQQFNNSVAAKQTLGIAFNNHRILNTLSSYETQIIRNGKGMNISINGKNRNKFTDFGEGATSRIHQSTVLSNIVLDSTKNGHADVLNLNLNSIGSAVVLVNLGFDIKTVGMLLNHPVAVEFINRFNNVGNDYLDSGTKGNIIRQMSEDLEAGVYFDYNEVNVITDPKHPDYNSEENNKEVMRTLYYLTKVGEDLSILSKKMAGHKDLERNPYALERQTKEFNELIENKNVNASLAFKPDPADPSGKQTLMSNSPEIKAYNHTSEKFAQEQKKMSLVFNDSVKDILANIAKKITHEELNDTQLKHFSEKLKPFIYSRLLGINNLDISEFEALFKNNGEGTDPYIIEDLRKYMEELDELNVTENPDNILDRSSDLTRSLLFNMAITIADGEISLQPDFLANLSPQLLVEVRKEFASLPMEIQEMLVIYDLAVNGWDTEKSIFPVFHEKIYRTVTKNAESLQRSMNDKNNKHRLPQAIIDEAFVRLRDIETYEPHSAFPKIYVQDLPNNPSKLKAFYSELLKHKLVGTKILGTEPFIVQVYNAKGVSFKYQINPHGKEFTSAFVKHSGLNANTIDFAKMVAWAKGRGKWANLSATILDNLQKSGYQIVTLAEPTRRRMTQATPAIVEILTIKDADFVAKPPYDAFDVWGGFRETQTPDYMHMMLQRKEKKNPISNETAISKGKPKGMAYRTDLQNYTSSDYLSRSEFLLAYQSKIPLTDIQMDMIYNNYVDQKEKANTLVESQFQPDQIADMSNDDLFEAYKKYGDRDMYAYANVLVPVMLEVLKRASAEQSALAQKYGNKATENGEDISVLKSWFQTNNIDSNHPATQAAQRQIETEYKNFQKERTKYFERINTATENLYKEKFGYNPTGSKLWNKIKIAFIALFKNRSKLYEELYGNLVDIETGIDKRGEPTKRYKLKAVAELNHLLNKGQISKAEYEFAQTFREITTELHPKVNDKHFVSGFVPAVAMGRMEAFAQKGLLGLLTNSKSRTELIDDVRMNFRGQTDVPFRVIKDIFRKEGGSNFKKTKEFYLLERKATDLQKQGKNEDGSAYVSSNIEQITLLGDGMVNHFANNGFVRADDFLSLDLNKALSDFTHTTLFVDGNGEFKGFLALQSLIDGLLIHNEMKGYVNQNKFVRKVMKESALKAYKGGDDITDLTLDALVKANLLYIMGWKLLIIGKGLYSVGNIMAGKYHNIKNHGGKAWIKGEKRYWGIGDGFNWKKSSNILKNLNFADINLYDLVSDERGSGLGNILADIALAPMQYSENWIQHVHLLGLLTDEQYNKFDENGNYKLGVEPIPVSEVIALENEVKSSHGKGYQATDQRMIQQFSWGRMVMQFSRFIPTMVHDRFAKEDVNIYGKEHAGTMTPIIQMIKKMVSGEITPAQAKTYRQSLSPAMQAKFDAGIRGFGLSTLALFGAVMFNSELLSELHGDANYVVNSENLEYKIMPSTVRTGHDFMGWFFGMFK